MYVLQEENSGHRERLPIEAAKGRDQISKDNGPKNEEDLGSGFGSSSTIQERVVSRGALLEICKCAKLPPG